MPDKLTAVRFTRERWGTCDMSIGFTSRPGMTERCGKPAVFVQKREDEDGNYPRYCAECARVA